MFHRRIRLATLLFACLLPGQLIAGELQESESALGVPSTIDLEHEAAELVWVEPGTRLRQEPDARSSPIAVIDARLQLRILGRQEGWLLVRYGAWKGWLPASGGTGRSPASGGTGPDPERLAKALGLLGLDVDHQPARLGPFDLHTDAEDRELLRFLAQVAAQLPATFAKRFGLDPGAGERETVVLFSREEDYRAFATEEILWTDSAPRGHASQGMAVLFVGPSADDTAAVLVHELTHLLSRRVFATPLPPWLDEGMANDLAFCRIDGIGELRLGTLGGRSVVIEEPVYRPGGWIGVDRRVRISGPVALLSLLANRRQAGEALPLALLADLLAAEFFDPNGREVRYDVSTFFVRYLLEGEKDGLAPSFRSFLASLAAGGGAAGDALVSHLGRTWPQLERGFAAWLDRQRRPL